MNSMWIVIFVSCSVNPYEITVHAKKKKKKKKWKRETENVPQDSAESKRSLYYRNAIFPHRIPSI